MNVIITGGAGCLGSHLVDKLIDLGHNIVVIDNSRENIKRNLVYNRKLKIVNMDINDTEIEPYFIGADWVVHLAARLNIVSSIENPIDYHQTNVTGTLKILELSRKNNIKRFIYAASGSCYGNEPKTPTSELEPINTMDPLATTKFLGEKYALDWGKTYKLPVVSLRFFSVFGPRSRTTENYGGVFETFLKQKLEGKPFTVVGDGYQSRDFVYISDACDAIYAALLSDKKGEVYNVGFGQHISIRNLIACLDQVQVTFLPKRPGEPQVTMANVSKIRQELGWYAKVSFAEGCKKTLDNIKYWKDATLWDKESIEKATKNWFKYLGDKNDTGKNQTT